MLVLLAVLIAAGAGANAAAAPVIEVFSRPGCPHCARAHAFLDELVTRRPEVTVVTHDVIADPAALQRLERLAAEHGIEQLGVPAFHVHGRLFVGFDTAESTGRELEEWLDRGAAPDPGSRAPPPREVSLPVLGPVSAGELGLPLFTIALGLVDGFNPCAMWVLLFLLSLLVNLRSRARMLLIGGTFVVVSGAVYYAFMAAWLNVFLLVGFTRGVQIALGLVAVGVGAIHIKDFFALHKGISLSIPDAAKPGIYARVRRIIQAENLAAAVLMAVALAAMVNMVELLCTAGLPAVYTQVLASHGLPAWQYYLYLGLYNLAYMLDDSVMLIIAVATLGRRKLQERGGRWLKLLSGAVMAALGIVLLFAPSWLSWQ
jgi:glutaredoxin